MIVEAVVSVVFDVAVFIASEVSRDFNICFLCSRTRITSSYVGTPPLPPPVPRTTLPLSLLLFLFKDEYPDPCGGGEGAFQTGAAPSISISGDKLRDADKDREEEILFVVAVGEIEGIVFLVV